MVYVCPSVGEESKMRGTITLRLDENVIAILRAESGTRHISFNALVNETLRNFVEWNLYEPKVGMMSLFRSVVAEIFKK